MRLTVAVGVLACAITAVALDRSGATPNGPYDAIVVPGCRVYANGEPSPALSRRVHHAIDLYDRGWAPVLVFTGGRGEAPRSEAETAGAIARSRGVGDEAIVLETRSTSTEENARFSAAIVDARRVLVVTDSYHAFRARRVFARYYGEATAVGSVPRPSVRVRGAIREVFAVAKYAARGQL